jgi:hypothetical protein
VGLLALATGSRALVVGQRPRHKRVAARRRGQVFGMCLPTGRSRRGGCFRCWHWHVLRRILQRHRQGVRGKYRSRGHRMEARMMIVAHLARGRTRPGLLMKQPFQPTQ